MRIFILIFFFLFQNKVNASIKSEIINNFKLTENLKFNFVQKIGKKIEKGECIIAYPKKIFCKYDERYNKILVSNGKSLVIKSDRRNQHYAYRLDKTPLNLILDFIDAATLFCNKKKNINTKILIIYLRTSLLPTWLALLTSPFTSIWSIILAALLYPICNFLCKNEVEAFLSVLIISSAVS